VAGPVHEPLRRDLLPAADQPVERPGRAVLHHDAVARGLRADTPGNKQRTKISPSTSVNPWTHYACGGEINAIFKKRPFFTFTLLKLAIKY
jgi:hypothetical protein